MRWCFNFSSKERKKYKFVFVLDFQDIEKEMRKEVDEAIAQAKVRWCNFYLASLGNLNNHMVNILNP